MLNGLDKILILASYIQIQSRLLTSDSPCISNINRLKCNYYAIAYFVLKNKLTTRLNGYGITVYVHLVGD